MMSELAELIIRIRKLRDEWHKLIRQRKRREANFKRTELLHALLEFFDAVSAETWVLDEYGEFSGVGQCQLRSEVTWENEIDEFSDTEDWDDFDEPLLTK